VSASAALWWLARPSLSDWGAALGAAPGLDPGLARTDHGDRP
jgi:hypothetical protein